MSAGAEATRPGGAVSEGLDAGHVVFERVAEAYDAARPHYPEALYLALEELSGVRLAGARVIDVGAGTGISTRGLLDRGARVVAVDRGGRMLGVLCSRTECAALLADGNELPFRDGAADLVTYAQAWHWLDPALSVAEAVRVLRPGGAVAGWWNTVDAGRADWLAAYQVRLAESCDGYVGPALPGWSMPPIAETMELAGLTVARTWVGWTRSVRLDDFLTDLRSHSYVARLDERDAEELVARERAELGRVFPDGRLTVPMRVYLATGRAEAPVV
ncbi:methyltransferase domain-containing protein [Microbispora sp. RL4-1S]|uniref:Methyltransferase domain-containing protein n=1 Tax=Microbispora oryzae TaxID=2806554 RepID=A0A941AL21_9ACTN|nr:class I SAM-dependent methyltransferase [Microbispora oryzae]MBP2708115.1 methyltransferase domain-containing protein [Microbispora oryzae]